MAEKHQSKPYGALWEIVRTNAERFAVNGLMFCFLYNAWLLQGVKIKCLICKLC